MSAAKLKLQAVLVAWHSLRMVIEDGTPYGHPRHPFFDEVAAAADKLRDRLEELEAIVGAETPSSLFDMSR